jgi:PTS system arbutin-like IIC component
MLSQIQRFGGAMFTPVLLFPFAGIVVGIAIMLRNPMFVGEALTAPDIYLRRSFTSLKRAAGRYFVICR